MHRAFRYAAFLAMLAGGIPSQAQKIVAAVGDSYGSGEGAPDVPAMDCSPPGPIRSPEEFRREMSSVACRLPAKWLANPPGATRNNIDLSLTDAGCHRSGRSGPAQGARLLRESNSVGTVDFLSAACTGAFIGNLDLAKGPTGVRTGFADGFMCGMGETEIGLLNRRAFVPAQLGLLDQALATTRRIDALVISIGGNDISISDIVISCMTNPPGENCMSGFDSSRISNVGSRLDSLAESINTQIGGRVGNMVLLAYPDPTHDEQGRQCGPNALGQADRCRGVTGDPADGVGCDESRDLSRRLIPALNSMLREFVDRQRAKGRGWHFVDAHLDAFRRRGYCSNDPFAHNLINGVLRQGQVCAVAHPNDGGYLAYGTAIAGKLKELAEPPTPQMLNQCSSCPTGTASSVNSVALRPRWAPPLGGPSLMQVAFLDVPPAFVPTSGLPKPPGQPGDSPTMLVNAKRISDISPTAGATLSPYLAAGNENPAPPPLWTATASEWRVYDLAPASPEFVRFGPQSSAIAAVRACTPMSCSGWSAPVWLSNRVPPSPTNVGGRYEGADQFTITWAHPDIDPIVDRFEIRVAAMPARAAAPYGPEAIPSRARAIQLSIAPADYVSVEMRACGPELCSDWARSTIWGRIQPKDRPEYLDALRKSETLPVEEILAPIDRLRRRIGR